VLAWAGWHEEADIHSTADTIVSTPPSSTVTHWIRLRRFNTKLGQVPLFLALMAPFLPEGAWIAFPEERVDSSDTAWTSKYKVYDCELLEWHATRNGTASTWKPYLECLFVCRPWVKKPQSLLFDPYVDVPAQFTAANGGVELRETFDRYGHISSRERFINGIQHGECHYYPYEGQGQHSHCVCTYVNGKIHGWGVDNTGSRHLFLDGEHIFDKRVIAAYEAAATAAGTTTGGTPTSTSVGVPVLPIPPTPDTPRAPTWSFGHSRH
jgi:hypothetical protein